MTRDELVECLTPVARIAFRDDNMILRDDLDATKVETWTSLSFMQFLAAIEEKFGFKFKIMELIQLRNMGSVIDAVLKHIV